MNKYEEALEIVQCKMHVEDWMCEIEKRSSEECAKCNCTKAYETLEELVEKATPKKTKYLYYENELVNYMCPNCGEAQGLNVNKWWNRFCPGCGQAIDWSDEE